MWPHTQNLYVAGLGTRLGYVAPYPDPVCGRPGYEARLCGPVTIGVADAMSCMI